MVIIAPRAGVDINTGIGKKPVDWVENLRGGKKSDCDTAGAWGLLGEVVLGKGARWVVVRICILEPGPENVADGPVFGELSVSARYTLIYCRDIWDRSFYPELRAYIQQGPGKVCWQSTVEVVASVLSSAILARTFGSRCRSGSR